MNSETMPANGAAEAPKTESSVNIPLVVRAEIDKKCEVLKKTHNLRHVYAVIVEGDSDSESKPFYIAYMRRPGLIHFSQYMNFINKDVVQASKMLANNVFLAGDRELIDDDELFLYGTMQQLNKLIDTRNSEFVKK